MQMYFFNILKVLLYGDYEESRQFLLMRLNAFKFLSVLWVFRYSDVSSLKNSVVDIIIIQ